MFGLLTVLAVLLAILVDLLGGSLSDQLCLHINTLLQITIIFCWETLSRSLAIHLLLEIWIQHDTTSLAPS